MNRFHLRISGLATAFLLPLMIGLSLPDEANAGDRAGFIDRGRAIATQNCAGCHAITRKGSSPNRASPPFRTLGQRYNIDDLDEAFVEGMTANHKGMPDFQFSASDTLAMLAYIKSVQPKGRAVR